VLLSGGKEKISIMLAALHSLKPRTLITDEMTAKNLLASLQE